LLFHQNKDGMQDSFARLLKFGLAGMAGVLIDFFITWLCKEKIKLNKFSANAAGFSFAVVNNYILNRVWTFSSSAPDLLQQFGWFLLISIIGLIFNSFILYVLHERKHIPFYPGKILAIGIVFCWNFAANNLVTFR